MADGQIQDIERDEEDWGLDKRVGRIHPRCGGGG